jgi:transcriptional regulator with GAF, ATPase, and Fis domain
MKQMKEPSFNLEGIIANITKRLMEDAETSRLYNAVVDIAMEATSAQACSLYLEEYDTKDSKSDLEQIVLVAGAGFEKSRINKARYKKGEGLTGTIWEKSEWIKCDSKEEIEDPNKGWIGKFNDTVREEIPDWKSTSLIGGPLKAGDKTIGILKLENKEPLKGQHFTDDDFKLLKLIAGVISLAIQNRRNLEYSYSKIFSAIIDVSEMILGNQVIPVNILRQKILLKCLSIYNAEASSLYLEEISSNLKEDPMIKMVAGEGYEKDRMEIAKYKKGEGLTGRIWELGQSVKYDTTLEIEDKSKGWKGKYNKHIKKVRNKWVCSSLMGVPLKVGERTIGVLKVENKKPSPEAHFTYDELHSLEIFASFIAFSLEMLKYHSELFFKGESARSIIHSLINIAASTKFHTERLEKQIAEKEIDRNKLEDIKNKLSSGIKEINESFEKHYQISEGKKDVVSFNNLIDKTTKLFGDIAKDNNIEFKINRLSKQVFVNIIEDHISRSLKNILSNAIDALSGIHNPKIIIDIKIVQTENVQKAILIINDNGSGLNPEQIKNFREKNIIKSTKHYWPGSGLAESQGFFKWHEINCEYKEKGEKENVLGGACFVIEFSTCKPGKSKVLVIDDQQSSLDSFDSHFNKQNDSLIEVDISMPYLKFIEKITSQNNYLRDPILGQYDWIFLDYELINTEYTGETLYYHIKKNEPEYAMKIILMSVHPTFITDNANLKVYSKFDELLKESFRVKIESNLICGRRP